MDRRQASEWGQIVSTIIGLVVLVFVVWDHRPSSPAFDTPFTTWSGLMKAWLPPAVIVVAMLCAAVLNIIAARRKHGASGDGKALEQEQDKKFQALESDFKLARTQINNLKQELGEASSSNLKLSRDLEHEKKMRASDAVSYELKAREVTEARAEAAAQTRTYDATFKGMKEEMDGFKRDLENARLKINEEVNQRDTWMKQYYQMEERLSDLKWLETRMNEQGESLKDYWVRIRKVSPVKLQLVKTPRMVVVGFWVLNNSMFDVTFNLKDISGCLQFKNRPHRDPVTIPSRHSPKAILKPGDYIEIVLEQPLLQSEAETILDSRQTADVNGIFWLGNLKIPISVEGIPQKVKPTQLAIYSEIEHLNVHDFPYDDNT